METTDTVKVFGGVGAGGPATRLSSVFGGQAGKGR